MSIIATEYKCQNLDCGAVDHDRTSTGSKPPVALNCWKCKAGRGLELSDMRARGIGMMPVSISEVH